ncbi:MAG: glycosyltransferase [Candidatus Pacearchaeota archaeon]|nr:glycosyltransferase [Candidatus Pacearchaeota archaeon]
MKIKYSFIIPTFNSSKTIEKCLKSIKKLNLKKEIIVVDDCSKDNTVEIAKRYADLIIIKEKRSGPAKSRNIGWRISRGKIVVFVDSDVYLGKKWVKDILPKLKNYDGVLSSLKASKSHDVTFNRWEEAANFFVIKRKILEEIGGYSEIFPYAAGEDSDLLIRLLKKGYKIRNQKTEYVHDVSHKKTKKQNIFKKFFKNWLWIFVCNLKNIDIPRCREFLFIKTPLKILGLLEKYKKIKKANL